MWLGSPAHGVCRANRLSSHPQLERTNLLRVSIYIFGGILFTVLWIAVSMARLSSNPSQGMSGIEMFLVPAIGWVILFRFDRWVHASLFGTRVVVRLKDYRPCPVCPVTGKAVVVPRNLLFAAHAAGPVHATIEYRLPILISREAEMLHPHSDVWNLPGMKISRFTNQKVTLYFKDKGYLAHFTAANLGAI